MDSRTSFETQEYDFPEISGPKFLFGTLFELWNIDFEPKMASGSPKIFFELTDWFSNSQVCLTDLKQASGRVRIFNNSSDRLIPTLLVQ